LPRQHCIQTLRKIFDNREDRHASQPETAGDQRDNKVVQRNIASAPLDQPARNAGCPVQFQARHCRMASHIVRGGGTVAVAKATACGGACSSMVRAGRS
jgi:hypothetical protein